MKKLGILAIALLVAIVFVGCDGAVALPGHTFEGTLDDYTYTAVFGKDGTVEYIEAVAAKNQTTTLPYRVKDKTQIYVDVTNPITQATSESFFGAYVNNMIYTNGGAVLKFVK